MMERRGFFGGLAGAMTGDWTSMAIPSHEGSTQDGEMPYRTLGKTGEKVSCIGLGGFHLGQSRLEASDAVKLFQEAIERGMNFSDNSWDYHQGESERRVGKALMSAIGANLSVLALGRRQQAVEGDSYRFVG